MGEFVKIKNPETLEKVKKAKELKLKGYTNKEIAEKMKLSNSRISELLRGVNWVSKTS